MLHTVRSRKSVEEIAARVPELCQEKQWSFLGEIRIKDKLSDRGFDLEPDVRILEVCSPRAAHHALSTHLPISTALPCRISVYPDGEETVIATLLPTKLLGVFERPDLDDLAREVEEQILEIVAEVA